MNLMRWQSVQAGVVLALLQSTAWAQSTVVVYQNDFENPSVTSCPDWGGTAKYSNASAEYGSAFQQVQTADRLCINPTPAPAGPAIYSDPSGQAGKYAIGFYGSTGPVGTESLALAIDPLGKPNVTVDVDLSIVKIANYMGSPVNFKPSTSFAINFYRLPAGQTYSLTGPTAMNSPATVNASTSGVLTALPDSQTVTVTTTATDPYTFNWNTKTLYANTSQFVTGDKLIVLFTALPLDDYVAIDNLVIRAVVPEVSVACTPTDLNDAAGQTATCTVTSTVPAPVGGLTVGMTPPPANARYSSTCGTSIQIAAGATTGTCTITATDNTTPGDGDVPAVLSLAAGTGYLLGATAQATVTVHNDDAAPVLPEVTVSCTPGSLNDAAGQEATCTISSNTPAPAGGITVGMTPPTANPRYTSTCGASVVIPAGATSASCTLTATANTVPGDGDVVAALSLAAGSGYQLGSAAQASVTVKDDDAVVTATAQPVPTVGFWGLLMLAFGLTGFGARFIRRLS